MSTSPPTSPPQCSMPRPASSFSHSQTLTHSHHREIHLAPWFVSSPQISLASSSFWLPGCPPSVVFFSSSASCSLPVTRTAEWSWSKWIRSAKRLTASVFPETACRCRVSTNRERGPPAPLESEWIHSIQSETNVSSDQYLRYLSEYFGRPMQRRSAGPPDNF